MAAPPPPALPGVGLSHGVSQQVLSFSNMSSAALPLALAGRASASGGSVLEPVDEWGPLGHVSLGSSERWWGLAEGDMGQGTPQT